MDRAYFSFLTEEAIDSFLEKRRSESLGGKMFEKHLWNSF